MRRVLASCCASLMCLLASSVHAAVSPPLPNSVLFVSQVPMPGDDVARATITSSFANHLPTTAAAPRGGDLMLMSPTGVLRNLTLEAGYGSTGANGFQDANAIAVRDPAVHWSGGKAVFSMAIGAPAQPNGIETAQWQLYEVSGLGSGQTASIVKVANQPPFNNIQPNYLSDGSLVFVSDRPRNGAAQLYPINDEYRGQPANSGLWRLDPASGDLRLLEHTPSGSFTPIVDSFGRIAFVRWDHLVQDINHTSPTPMFGVFDYASEAANAATQTAVELFPEPITAVPNSNVNSFEINQFFPWTINQDGSREETVNHIGRHELRLGLPRTFTNDASLINFIAATSGRTNVNPIFNFFQLREDPVVHGRYVGIDATEFGTHASGQIVALNAAQNGVLSNAHDMTIQYVTNRATQSIASNANNIGHFRDPLPMSDGTTATEGTLLAAFSPTPGAEPSPTAAAIYQFRLTRLSKNRSASNDALNTTNLTGGIAKSVSYYVGATLTAYSGNLWELQPVEVYAHAAPVAMTEPALATPEQNAFTAAQVAESDMRAFLQAQGLALLVIRNVTSRDGADRQQPFNLHVPNGTQTLGDNGTLYDIDEVQFFEADQVRGFGTPANPLPGRRTMTRYLNDVQAQRFNPTGALNPGAQPIAADGSVALFVPARRAMAWQSLTPAAGSATLGPNTPVVRERYWIEYQAGEIRACDGCHGVNTTNQAGLPASSNTPQALIDLLNWWRLHDDRIFVDGFDP